MFVDLNCDMGEGMNNEAAIMPYIQSANIACGAHAGDEETMRRVIALCLLHGVKPGAHPSYPDRENFGRTVMVMPEEELYECLSEQLYRMDRIAKAAGTELHHVKPHGALYNESARDSKIATIIARAVKELNPTLVLYGLSGSMSIDMAKRAGLQTAAEVFADRTYQDDGSLTPRSMNNALIHTPEEAIAQVVQMVQEGSVRTVNQKTIAIQAETICIHGDGAAAVVFARSLYEALHTKGLLAKSAQH